MSYLGLFYHFIKGKKWVNIFTNAYGQPDRKIPDFCYAFYIIEGIKKHLRETLKKNLKIFCSKPPKTSDGGFHDPNWVSGVNIYVWIFREFGQALVYWMIIHVNECPALHRGELNWALFNSSWNRISLVPTFCSPRRKLPSFIYKSRQHSPSSVNSKWARFYIYDANIFSRSTFPGQL